MTVHALSHVDAPKDHYMLEPQEPPRMIVYHKRKPAWAREIIQDA